MRVTLAQLEAFYWTATQSSVERAAEVLSIAQPTVSLRLRGLEDALGYKPLERVGRGLKLTVRGQDLLDECRTLFASIEKIATKPTAQELAGPIRLGFAEGFAMICLPRIVSRLHSEYPELQPELMVATSAEVEPELHSLRLDLAFLVHPTEHEHFKLVPLGTQETSWIASKSFDLPSIVRPKDIVTLPIISNPTGSINYRQMTGWFASAGLKPSRVDFCNSVSMLANLVNNGVGLGIYPNKLAERQLSEGTVTVLQTDPPIADTPIYAKYHRESRKAKVEAVLTTATSVLGELDYLK
ncbi:LysR family transcriptional regulator [Rhizobium sp. NTR19]|uniref:LysR family transcriptional regulator n=1 Tax=Neorhizobium turbinariae TaxID=2937795 RepID=A0ABT0IXU2_9HYPH|nr:LysR family transcriptional regulator [Neorhizobium turbinariae]MCK8782712.1 LysR family transcriptional regulator [Neorhizobium turbinariae]